MFNQMKSFVCLFILSVVFYSPITRAGVGLDLVGAGTYAMPKGSATDPTPKLSLPGGGILFSFGKIRFRVELGATYLTRVYTLGSDQTTRLLKGSLGFKLGLFRHVELVLGGYGNRIFSSDEGLTGNDAGVFGGLNLKIPFGSKVALLLSPRYNYALTKLTASEGYTITPHEVQALVGLSFGGRMGK